MKDEVLLPSEIRRIRERLGLSQVEAGKILGGGPRAFTKYETGSMSPAASTNNLLRLLDADPTALTLLLENGGSRAPVTRFSPFDVSGKEIVRLEEADWPGLLRRLLHAEAVTHGIPEHGIHVSEDRHTGDGGEDGRITWPEGPASTRFLPSRRCQFQLKSGPMKPAQAGDEVAPRKRSVELKERTVKPLVRDFLENHGTYILLCGHSYVRKLIDARKAAILAALREAGLEVGDDQVDFRDADQIAAWVNSLGPVATWVKERTDPGKLGPFRSWENWSGWHSVPWVEDERLPGLQQSLRAVAAEPRKILRDSRAIGSWQVPSRSRSVPARCQRW